MAQPAVAILAHHPADPGMAVAVYGEAARTPRVFASSSMDAVLKAMQREAIAKLGMPIMSE